MEQHKEYTLHLDYKLHSLTYLQQSLKICIEWFQSCDNNSLAEDFRVDAIFISNSIPSNYEFEYTTALDN